MWKAVVLLGTSLAIIVSAEFFFAVIHDRFLPHSVERTLVVEGSEEGHAVMSVQEVPVHGGRAHTGYYLALSGVMLLAVSLTAYGIVSRRGRRHRRQTARQGVRRP
jgi:hypothetical protein